MENKLLQSLAAHYNAELQRAEANLMNYFQNSAGVSEHADVVGEMVKLVDAVSHARGGLAVLNSYVQPPEGAEEAPEDAPAEEGN